MPKSKSIISVLLLLLLLIFNVLSLNGCSFKIPNPFPKEVSTSNLPAEALIIDGSIYDRITALINSAQTSIYVEQAEFDDPRLIQLLITKADSGVDIRILLDQWQKVNRTTLDQLKSQNNPNISIQFYPAQKGQYDHIKLLVIDQNQALINGPAWTGSGFQAHDLAVELTGRSAWKAAGLFSKDWAFTTTFPLPVSNTSSLPEDNIVLATNASIKKQLTDLIATTTQSIWIENPEITDPDLKQALIDARKKGHEVRLILDRSMANEYPITIEDLKAKAVQIRYYPNQPTLGIHLAIIDNTKFLLSSSSWTHSSFIINHEISLTAPSPVASAKAAEIFSQDWDKSTEQ